ncbi:hypothetical protein [Streptomyces spiramyceticus]|uniref:hypothetical protein n=1 Tax=Streptomyces spiramyceticus TaxID=299717 RepID=UPI00237BF66F|nr:hypothetical protein [Streptomyces spiramyceticus]
MTQARPVTTATSAGTTPQPPFHITKEEERRLRIQAERIEPALVISQPSSFDEYVRQLMVPPAVMDLAHKAANLRLSAWEIQAVRWHLEPTTDTQPRLLRQILHDKVYGENGDRSHPPYIRVACTGKGKYDDLARDHGVAEPYFDENARYGSPVVLEIWPAQHYSPMHSHGNTTGIVYCLAGQLDVMSYGALRWDAEKRGLVTLTPGQCAWLTRETYAVHKVFCPMDGNGMSEDGLMNNSADFGASFHVYLNEKEVHLDAYEGADLTREVFHYIHEKEPHDERKFTTYSDLSWPVLREVLAKTPIQ